MAKITNVLSLFDGLSCGQIALNRAGIEYDNYFASEIDKHAIKVTQTNYPKTIQLGDVTKVKVKLLCLSEVYSYICSYDSNLQSNISEWEVLYWLNKDFTLSAKIRTQKPISLLSYLIRTYTNEGDLVLDNTAGSMSTAIAAIGTNRKCICIEKDDNYFAIGQKRVDEKLKETINQQLKIF